MKESTKKVWRKTGWFCYTYTPMIAYLVLVVIVVGIGSALLGMIAVLNGEADINGFIMGKLMILNAISQLVATVVFGIWYYFGCKRPSPKPRQFFKPKYIFAVLLAGIGIQFVVSMILNCLDELNPKLIEDYSQMMEKAGITETSAAVILSVVLLAPVVEELVFRGLTFYIARQFTERFWLANIMQALAFGIMHLNIVQGIYAFFMGLFMGWVYYRFRSLYASIWIHLVINLAGTVFMEPLYALLPPSWLSLIALFAVGILLILIGMRLMRTNRYEY